MIDYAEPGLAGVQRTPASPGLYETDHVLHGAILLS